MKTNWILLFAMLLVSGFVMAQDKDKDKDKDSDDFSGKRKEMIQSQKIAFITQKLELTPEEAQVFWPLYNEYQKKDEALSLERRKYMKEIKEKTEGISEKEAETLADKIVESEVTEANLMKEYHGKFKKALPKSKVLKLYQAEHQFKRQLLHDMRGKKGGGHHRDKPQDE